MVSGHHRTWWPFSADGYTSGQGTTVEVGRNSHRGESLCLTNLPFGEAQPLVISFFEAVIPFVPGLWVPRRFPTLDEGRLTFISFVFFFVSLLAFTRSLNTYVLLCKICVSPSSCNAPSDGLFALIISVSVANYVSGTLASSSNVWSSKSSSLTISSSISNSTLAYWSAIWFISFSLRSSKSPSLAYHFVSV